jgi:hypothetical protein
MLLRLRLRRLAPPESVNEALRGLIRLMSEIKRAGEMKEAA